METVIHNHLDYKLCLSILRTLQTDKDLNESNTRDVLSIITFEDNPMINSIRNLGMNIDDSHAVTLIEAKFNLHDKRETWVIFKMFYDGIFVAAFREGDPIEGTEKDTEDHLEDFRDGLGFFYKLCFCLKNPDRRKEYDINEEDYDLKGINL